MRLNNLPSAPTLIVSFLILSLGIAVGALLAGGNSTVSATVVGGLLTIFGGLSASFFAFLNEREKWKNQVEEEEKRRVREEAASDRKKMEEIYTNVLFYLNAAGNEQVMRFQSTGSYDGPATDKELEFFSELDKWSNILLLNLPIGVENEAITSFKREIGSRRMLHYLVSYVKKIAESDPRVTYTDAPKIRSGLELHFEISDHVIRENIISGRYVPKKYIVTVGMKDLSDSQRHILADLYFNPEVALPEVMELRVPMFDPSTGNIESVVWNSRIWPRPPQFRTSESTNSAFLQAWEDDYKQAGIQATNQKAEQAQL